MDIPIHQVVGFSLQSLQSSAITLLCFSPTRHCEVLLSLGRILHQTGYASGGYGKHAPGTLPAIQSGQETTGRELKLGRAEMPQETRNDTVSRSFLEEPTNWAPTPRLYAALDFTGPWAGVCSGGRGVGHLTEYNLQRKKNNNAAVTCCSSTSITSSSHEVAFWVWVSMGLSIVTGAGAANQDPTIK